MPRLKAELCIFWVITKILQMFQIKYDLVNNNSSNIAKHTAKVLKLKIENIDVETAVTI